MMIDEFLPVYDVRERHEITLRVPRERAYAAVRALDLSDSATIRALFLLRGVPALLSPRGRRASPNRGLGLTLDALLRNGFVLLGEHPGEELVLGLAGRFWTAGGDLQRLDPDAFRAFGRPGYARAVWNFHLSSGSGGATRLSTETRVQCADAATRRRFLWYWSFVRPFSGLTRILALRAIKRAAEAGVAQAPPP